MPLKLVNEPGNEFDNNAIAVYLADEKVGYLATKNPKTAQMNYKLHNPCSPLLIGEVKYEDIVKEVRNPSYIDRP